MTSAPHHLVAVVVAASLAALTAAALTPANFTKLDTLLSRDLPLKSPVSVPLNPAWQYFSFCEDDELYLPPPNQNVLWFPAGCPPFQPLESPPMAKTVPGCSPEQVSVAWWGADPVTTKASILVSWATCAPDSVYGGWTAATSVPALSTDAATSVVRLGRLPGVYTRTINGIATSFNVSFYDAPGGGSYASPILHHALATELEPGKWFYKIEDGVQLAGVPAGTTPAYGSFEVPAFGQFPYTIAVLGDPGQLVNSTVSLDQAIALKPQLALITGDMPYADSINSNPKVSPGATLADQTAFFAAHGKRMRFFGPRWDSYVRFVSRLVASVPFIATNGNHEIEWAPFNTSPYAYDPPGSSCNVFACQMNFTTGQLNYNQRLPKPQTDTLRATGPTLASMAPLVAADPSSYTNNAWSRYEIPGVATVITLSQYIPSDDATTSSAQYQWLLAELTQRPPDRVKTPWLIVMNHAPWYSTFAKHWLEPECWRKTYEPLLLWAGVDVFITGHDHAYERSYPVANHAVDTECGITHITTGGAGADDLTIGYIDEVLGTVSDLGYWKAKYCLGPNTINPNQPFWPVWYTPQNPTQYGPNGWCTPPPEILCPAGRPAWSAYREQSYGTGSLKILSPTEAVWEWSSHAAPHKPSDAVVIKRSAVRQAACSAKHPQPFVKSFNATLALSTLNASLASVKAAGLGKPSLDPAGPAAAAAALKADLAWRVNDTLAAVGEKNVAWQRILNATQDKFKIGKWA